MLHGWVGEERGAQEPWVGGLPCCQWWAWARGLAGEQYLVGRGKACTAVGEGSLHGCRWLRTALSGWTADPRCGRACCATRTRPACARRRPPTRCLVCDHPLLPTLRQDLLRDMDTLMRSLPPTAQARGGGAEGGGLRRGGVAGATRLQRAGPGSPVPDLGALAPAALRRPRLHARCPNPRLTHPPAGG